MMRFNGESCPHAAALFLSLLAVSCGEPAPDEEGIAVAGLLREMGRTGPTADDGILHLRVGDEFNLDPGPEVPRILGERVAGLGPEAHPIPVERVRIDRDLRLAGFDYSQYCGVRAELEERIRSHLVNVWAGRRPGADVAEPPAIDFEGNAVLWFADFGVLASFAESVHVFSAGDEEPLTAIVVVVHSDFGSKGLSLWTVPATDREVVFEVIHVPNHGP